MIQGGWDQNIGQQQAWGQKPRTNQPQAAGVIGAGDGYGRQPKPGRFDNFPKPQPGPMPVKPNPLQPEFPAPGLPVPNPTPQPMQAQPDALDSMTQGEPMQSNLVAMQDPRLLEELRRQQMLSQYRGQ